PRLLPEHGDHHRRDGLVELEDDVAHESVADDDVDRAAITSPGRQISSFDVALEVDASRAKQMVRFFHGGVSLFRLFTDAEQSNNRVVSTKDVLGIDGSESCELHELLRRAIDVGA